MSYYPFIKDNYRCFINQNIEEMTNLFPIEHYIIKKTIKIKSYTSDFLNISLITDSNAPPYIYLSGINGAKNLDKIKEYNITFILNCTKDIPNYFENNTSIKYMRVPIDDTSNMHIEKYFAATYDFIDNAVSSNNNILVHCYAGMSRSATILIAYFMRKYKWSYVKALKFVKEKRSIVNPNSDFVDALEKYQMELKII